VTMGRPELFSYLSAFVSIVLAIALSNVVQSVNLLIQNRRVVRWDARPLVFAAAAALGVVSEFFSIWNELALDHISFWRLLWLLCVPTLFALLAYSVLPSAVPTDGIDLARFYEDERRSWIILFVLITATDSARGLEHFYDRGELALGIRTALTTALPMAASFAIIALARRRWLSWIGLAVPVVVTLYGVSGWSIDLRPTAATSVG
jgi:hypothetical protein